MAKKDSSSIAIPAKKWGIDTTNHFHLSLSEIRAVLDVLMINIDEFTENNGRASDEVIVLSTQHVYHSLHALETMSYELEDGNDVGDLSLALMWARALIEIVDGMFHASAWEVNLGNSILSNHFAAVGRRIDEAHSQVTEIHASLFQKAA